MLRRISWLSAILLGVLVMVPHALARTWYVSPIGSDQNDGRSRQSALRTAQLAHDQAEPGDTILLTEGVYTVTSGQGLITVSRSGEAGRPITITADKGTLIRNHGAWNVLRIQGARHIVVRGLVMEGLGPEIPLDEARREMSNLQNPRTSGNGIGIVSHPQTGEPSAFITIADCVVRDMPGGGIYVMHSDYVTIEGNVVSGCGFTAPYANSGISIYQPVDIDDNTETYKLIIRNNISFGNYNHIPFYFSNVAEPEKRMVTDGNGIILDDFFHTQAFGGARAKPYGGRTLVANNISFDNGGSGIHAFLASRVDIVHNYTAGNNRHPRIRDGQIFANASQDIRVLNNILIAPAGKPVNSNHNNRSGVLYDNNIYATEDGSQAVYTRDLLGNRLADPGLRLVDWATGGRSFVVTPESPIRGGGRLFPEADTDFFGRPRGSAPDIGPFVVD